MNAIFQLVFSTLLLVQLDAAAFIPFHKLTNPSNRRMSVNDLFSNNYIDEYKSDTTDEVVKSKTCDYYDYKDPCHYSNDGCGKRTETCVYSSPGCYSLWSGNEILLQGCWLPSSREECTVGACIADQPMSMFVSKQTDEGTYFCCCFGNHCNENYGLSNHIPEWP